MESHGKSHGRGCWRHCKRCGTLAEFGLRTVKGRSKPQPYCKRCMVEYHAAWRAGKGAEKFRAGDLASKARHPERRRARSLVYSALKSGRLVPGPCWHADATCGGKIEAHHDDYSRPLNVTWTCRKHHRVLDQTREERTARGAA